MLLHAQDLVVRRGRVTVLRDVDLRAEQGDVVLLQGGNGTGKTSLLRVLAGLLRPSRGTLVVHGAAAFLPADAALPPVPVAAWRRELGAVAGEDRRIAGRLSTGQARRVALDVVLERSPSLLLLDEPFAGLDADARAALTVRLHAAAAAGATVVVAEHRPPADLAPGAVWLAAGGTVTARA